VAIAPVLAPIADILTTVADILALITDAALVQRVPAVLAPIADVLTAVPYVFPAIANVLAPVAPVLETVHPVLYLIRVPGTDRRLRPGGERGNQQQHQNRGQSWNSNYCTHLHLLILSAGLTPGVGSWPGVLTAMASRPS
jgi:hypothetical protein